ncbi:MAG: Kef family K(+) transporter [Xanthobacteraceae bacterium]|nr:Kef family K(+) transporter [Xanthobacteraceae bacterium]MCW5673830.1 Kef family K(+) transporter [Xanthobacteraceae bacterium]
MPHYTPLIATIVAGLVLAFIFGSIAHRLRISPIVGYLLAGVLAGPYTPGFVADQALANELAELGVILLMFGVGLHFSLKDLLSVRAIAIPGAIAQIGVATLMGMGMAYFLGWGLIAGFVFGLALSVASTVVLLRALQERRLVETERGRIAVGWLIVEDLAMVLALVLLPALAGLIMAKDALADAAMWQPIAITLGKVAAFVVVMLVIGQRVVPWLLHWVAHTGSRELFRLSVLAIAIGIAYAASTLFGASFALGAFFAGMVMSESPLSQRAAEETLPLRDAFAVLFFVSVGMLFNPAIVLEHPWLLAGTIFIIVFGKSIAAFLIVRAFRYPTTTALTISASLAQIGEFSFILAGLGVALKLMPQTGLDLILAGAIISIMLNPFVFQAIDWIKPKLEKRKAKTEEEIAGPAEPAEEAAATLTPTSLANHAVIVGYGRVGSHIGDRLRELNIPYLVIEDRTDVVKQLRARGIEVFFGNAASSELLAAVNLPHARTLFVAIPESFEAGQIVEQARKANPSLEIVARAHSDAEKDNLNRLGASFTIMGEREIAQGMMDYAFKNAATPGPATQATTKADEL